MIRFPITELLDEQKCYDFLLRILHPDGLKCPAGHPLPENQAPHDRSRAPIVDYRYHICRRVYNLFTGTVWAGTHYDCATIVLVMRGIVQGVPTQQLADELEIDYGNLLSIRHQIQQLAQQSKLTYPLPDDQTEADEMFQNAGEKGVPHRDEDNPTRRRANKQRGRGTMENDRPPILGTVGRDSGQIRLTVCLNTQRDTIQPQVETSTSPKATLYTDESSAYERIDESGRHHLD